MKNTLLLLPVFAFLFYVNADAQIDTTRHHELRISPFGEVMIRPYIDPRINYRSNLNQVSIAYLKRYKKSPYLMKAVVSGSSLNQNHYDNEGSFGRSTGGNINLFLGLEKQYQFRHFGAFTSVGMQGGYAKFKGNYDLPDSAPIRDFELSSKYIGAKLGLTAMVNVRNNVYLYWSTSILTTYNSENSSQQINGDCCEDGNGFDFRMRPADAIGLSFKF